MALPTAVTFATMAVAYLALINVRSSFNHAASPRDAKEHPILSRVGGRACFTAKDASPSRSKGRTGNGHPSNTCAHGWEGGAELGVTYPIVVFNVR
jgi:hypothetical protein